MQLGWMLQLSRQSKVEATAGAENVCHTEWGAFICSCVSSISSVWGGVYCQYDLIIFNWIEKTLNF